MKLVVLFCALAWICVLTLAEEPLQWSFITTNNKGTRVPVALGLSRRNMLIIPDKIHNPKRCTERTINQHDFKEGLVAMKVPAKRACLVKPLGKRETYEDMKKLIESGEEMIQHDENWTVPERAIEKDQVKKEIGSLLADFCAHTKVYRLQRDTSAAEARGWKKCYFNCGSCTVSTELSESSEQ